MTILLKNLLAKTDLVSKNVSKIGKKVDFGWSLVILTFFTNRWDFEQIQPWYKSYMPVLVGHFYFTNSLLTARLQCNPV